VWKKIKTQNSTGLKENFWLLVREKFRKIPFRSEHVHVVSQCREKFRVWGDPPYG
jgi:hypothetical protein